MLNYNLRFNRPVLPFDLYIQAGLFVLDTPACYWEVIKRLAAYQRHGNLTLTWFSCDRPHCLRRLHAEKSLITLGLWLDGSIIVPIACHRHTGSRPVLIADYFSLHAGKMEARRP